MSPFFGIGIRPNIFQVSGNIPSEKERFNKIARGFDIFFDTAFNIRLLMSSSPFALLGVKFSIINSISSSVQETLVRELGDLQYKGDKVVFRSSTFEMEAK